MNNFYNSGTSWEWVLAQPPLVTTGSWGTAQPLISIEALVSLIVSYSEIQNDEYYKEQKSL